MSHYKIAVFSNTPDTYSFDRLLDPYSENNKAEFIFEPVTQEELDDRWKKFQEYNHGWTYEDWLKEMYNEQNGVYGHLYNPHGYYDYYTLGGGSYMMDLLPEIQEELEIKYKNYENGEFPENFPKSWYDWKLEANVGSESKLRKEWKKYSVEGDGWFTAEYYLERYKDEETYVRQMQYPIVPFAFVTPDGVWHAPGRVGWFAMSDETAESWDAYVAEWIDFIRNAPECYVNLVDCHI